jgi:hypothetical protein
MLNNLTNLFNLIKTRMVKTVLEDDDLFVVGTRDGRYDGNYKPTVAPLNVVVQAVISQLPPVPPGLYGLFSQTVSSTPVAATITEGSLIGTGLGSLSVAQNGFAVGDSFRATFAGHISAHNNDTLRLRVKSGSVLLADTGAITMPGITNLHWTMWIDFTVRAIGPAGTAVIASGGQFTYMKNASNAFEGDAFSIINNTTFDTTVLNTLSVTAQWSSNNADNSIYSELFNLYKTY